MAPIAVHTLPLAVEASIGVATYPDNGEEAQVLIQRADVAMYEAKRDSTSACFFDQEPHQYDTNRLTLVGELRRAIEHDELVLHYRPKALLDNSSVRSVEALVRWQHPTRGLIFPDAFIPIAQETSLIGPLTLHVVKMALRQGRKWRDEGLDLTIAVNLSTRNLLDRSFVMRMNEEHDDVAIVRSTIDLGCNLGLDVVAEGVETREIWDKLPELGCQTAQGYYLSRPVPAEMLTEWLRERSRVAVATAAAGA